MREGWAALFLAVARRIRRGTGDDAARTVAPRMPQCGVDGHPERPNARLDDGIAGRLDFVTAGHLELVHGGLHKQEKKVNSPYKDK